MIPGSSVFYSDKRLIEEHKNTNDFHPGSLPILYYLVECNILCSGTILNLAAGWFSNPFASQSIIYSQQRG